MALRDYRLLAQFAAVVEAGSVRAAARRLGLSPPSVSEALRDLESDLGVDLFRRTGNRLTPTAAGRHLATDALAMVAAAERGLAATRSSRQHPRGSVAITVPTELAISWLPPRLTRFEARYPDVRPTIHALDTVVDLTESAIDLAVRATYHETAGSVGDAVDVLPIAFVAAAGRAPSRDLPLAERLHALPLIAFSARSGASTLVVHTGSGERREFTMVPKVNVNNLFIAKELALQGLGATMVLRETVAADLAAGRMVEVAPDVSFGVVALRILHRDRVPTPAAAALSRHLGAAV